MKHIFVVHSPLTYIVSLGVIYKEQIKREDAIIVSTNYYQKEPIEIRIIKMPTKKDLFFKFRVRDWFNPIKYGFREIDKLINNDSFYLYVPAFSHFSKIFLIHPHCKAFSFLEEGYSSYRDSFDLEYLVSQYRGLSFVPTKKDILRTVLLAIRGYGEKFISIPYLYNSFHGMQGIRYYCITSIAFPFQKEKIIIKPQDIIIFYDIKNIISIDDSYVWIGTPFQEDISILVKKCVEYLKEKNIVEIYVRFHPRESIASQQKTIKIFRKNGINIHMIDKKMIFEFVLYSSKNITLMGYNSTLLYMAPLLKHKSIFFT